MMWEVKTIQKMYTFMDLRPTVTKLESLRLLHMFENALKIPHSSQALTLDISGTGDQKKNKKYEFCSKYIKNRSSKKKGDILT